MKTKSLMIFIQIMLFINHLNLYPAEWEKPDFCFDNQIEAIQKLFMKDPKLSWRDPEEISSSLEILLSRIEESGLSFTNEQIQEALKSKNIDFQIKTALGRNALHVASKNNSTKAVKFLITIIDINSKDSNGKTPLHLSLENIAILIELLGANADPNARDSIGMTPLMWAAFQGKKSSVEMLLNYADKNLKANGNTAEGYAKLGNFVEIAELIKNNRL